MKVLFLTHNYPRRPGDASGSFLQLLATALRGEDVDVRVVAPADAGLPATEMVEGIQVDRFHYAPRGQETLAYAGNMATQVRESWGARMKLLGFLGSEFRCAVKARRAFEPDIIHAHWWFPNGLVGTWTARMSDKPLVTTLHGTDVRLARTVAFSRPGFRHVLQHSAAVTAVSQFLAREASKVVSTATPQVAPMPVATQLFSPSQNGGRKEDRLLFVGRLNAQKGIEMLLRAIAVTTHKPMLDVVGDGPDEERLKALAGELEIADRIRWIGALPQQQLTEYYRSATALVVPSVHEGLGLVAVEAQLCETPVIAFDSGGLSDVVSNGQTGILVEDISASALAAAIDALLASPDRGAALGAAGRLHALATFAPESVARRYATLYRSVARAS
jgi:glycosyltransferase involved in cell wall biosynthesis